MRQSNTVFAQVQALLPRHLFPAIVARYRGDHKVHFVDCWALFWCLLWAQITQRRSLREIELIGPHHAGLLGACGIRSTHRATLSRAQTQRPWPVAAALFERLLGQLQRVTPHQPLDYVLPRFALDADHRPMMKLSALSGLRPRAFLMPFSPSFCWTEDWPLELVV